MGRYADRSRQEDDGAPPAAVRAGGGDTLSVPPPALRTILSGSVDFAGLFPPASLDMPAAVSEFDEQRRSPQRWALGRFVVPLARWDELEQAVRECVHDASPWPLSVLAPLAEVESILRTAGRSSRLRVESVESKVASAGELAGARGLVDAGLDVFIEPVSLASFSAMAPALARAGVSGKIRTGGITADAFPTAQDVLGFLRSCADAGIRFKATAGLHHAVRGEYRLTYDPDPQAGVMFGFLNIAVAAALVWHGRDDAVVLRVLDERSRDAFVFDDDGISWRGERLSHADLEVVRSRFFAGFGSCSFREPMADVGLAEVAGGGAS